MVDDRKKIIWLTIAVLTVTFLVGWYFWNKTTTQMKRTLSDASALTYKAFLRSYEKDGFTQEEVNLLTGYLARSLASGVCQECHVKDIKVGMVSTSSSTFNVSGITIFLREAGVIKIDYIYYDGKKTEITFSVSRDMEGPLGSFKGGKVYIISIQDGHWHIRR